MFFSFYRVMIASVLGFLIAIFFLGLGSAFGRSLGLEENHSMGEVILAFIAGGLVMLVYRDKLETRNKGEK